MVKILVGTGEHGGLFLSYSYRNKVTRGDKACPSPPSSRLSRCTYKSREIALGLELKNTGKTEGVQNTLQCFGTRKKKYRFIFKIV